MTVKDMVTAVVVPTKLQSHEVNRKRVKRSHVSDASLVRIVLPTGRLLMCSEPWTVLSSNHLS